MSRERPIERPARARPVADAPVDALLARADELSRRWAAALILARPLSAIAEIPLADLARSAPALCEGLTRALASDEELERLARGDAERAAPAPLAVARDASTLVADVDALRSILWQATLAELRDPPARLVADVADRLAYVCATALAAMLDARGDGVNAPRTSRAATQPPADARVLYGTRPPAPARSGAVLIDELGIEPRPLAPDDDAAEGVADAGASDVASVTAGARGFAPVVRASAVSPSTPASERARTAPRARPWDTPLSDEPAMRVRRGPGAPVDERS